MFPSRFKRNLSQSSNNRDSSFHTLNRRFQSNNKNCESIALGQKENANNQNGIEAINNNDENGSSLALNYFANGSDNLEKSNSCQLNTIAFDLPAKRTIKKRQTFLY